MSENSQIEKMVHDFTSFIAIVNKLKTIKDIRAHIKSIVNPEVIPQFSNVYFTGSTMSTKEECEKHYKPFVKKAIESQSHISIGKQRYVSLPTASYNGVIFL